jgi:hypothetical protein
MEQQRSLEEIRQESHPHACLDGHVYLGIIRVNEDGEEEEVISRVECQRCKAERQRIPQRWFPSLGSPDDAA